MYSVDYPCGCGGIKIFNIVQSGEIKENKSQIKKKRGRKNVLFVYIENMVIKQAGKNKNNQRKRK